MKITTIEGIGENYAQKLTQAGIKSPKSLLKHGHTAVKRKRLAAETGISEKLILEWVQHADLLRLEGIGPAYAGLLEEVGVDSSRELAQRNIHNLVEALQRTNEDKQLVRRLPSINQLEKARKSAFEINQGIHRANGLAGNGTTPPPFPGPVVEF